MLQFFGWVFLLPFCSCVGKPDGPVTTTVGYEVRCPGTCMSLKESCQTIDEADCGENLKCCLDNRDLTSESEETTEQVENLGFPAFDRGSIEVESRSEVEASDFDVEDLEDEGSLEPEVDAIENSQTKCSGACLPESYADYCEYILPEATCPVGTVCCTNGQEVPVLSTVFKESYQQHESSKNRKFPLFPSDDTVEEHCPGNCIPNADPCDEDMTGYLCPLGSKCCRKATKGSSYFPTLVNCTGICVSDHVRWVCQPPRELVLLSNCRKGTTCCHEVPRLERRHQSFPWQNRYPSYFQDSTSYYQDVITRLVKDETGQIYHVSLDGKLIPLPHLSPRDHTLNRYFQVTEINHGDEFKIVIFVDSNNFLYQQLIKTGLKPRARHGLGPYSKVSSSQENFGMPIEEELEKLEEKQKSEETDFSEKRDIEETLQDIVIPEENEASIQVPFSDALESLHPSCPGSCLPFYLRFTCFGKSAIYDGFSCENKEMVCCASLSAIEKHEEYLELLSPLQQSQIKRPSSDLPPCGAKTRKKTLGQIAFAGDWCWQVAIINMMYQYMCGGAIIDNSWVLTAAHCVSGSLRENQKILVRAGVSDLTNEQENRHAQTILVASIYIHHHHNSVTLDNDIALLKLEKPFKLNSKVCVVCLPKPGQMPASGTKCVVSGYGFPADDGLMSLKIQAAEVELVEDTECMANITETISIVYLLPASSFCAGKGTSCQGDAGGPLVCENNGKYELYGLLSWTLECANRSIPSVYVKVGAEMGWINQIVTEALSKKTT